VFKLVIVEDEDNIRYSLQNYIPWGQIGFQVVGAFADGSDALAYLKDNPCDVVLTDLLMSRMSGLEMIRALYGIHPQIKVVILSGHSEFSFAQQAIEYKVSHYLVKPVDEEELMSVFKNLRAELELHSVDVSVAESENRDLKLMLQKSFFRDLLSGHVSTDSELRVYLKLLGFEDVDLSCPLLAFGISGTERSESFREENAGVSADELIQTYLGAGDNAARIFLMEDRNNNWRVIFIGTPESTGGNLRKHCNEKLQALVSAMTEQTPYEYHFHLTHSVAQLAELLPESTVSQPAAQSRQVDGALCEAVVSDYRLLIVELDLGSQDTLLHLLNAVLYRLKDVSVEDAQFALKNLYSVVELEYRKRKLSTWDLTDGKFNFNHLYRTKDMETVSTLLKEDFCILCAGLKAKKPTSDHGVVGHLVRYLNEHLEEDIAHEELANKYRIHPGYLSRLFKQEMGETLSEYLLRIRIEKAAALLKEGRYKVGEIAGMVGYSASSYFSIMFKKYTGYSPREYSQRISL